MRMPNDPRLIDEPTLDDLSAYLDHELEPSTQARIADHIAGCADCRARLDGLRQTAYAIRGLPMESPPRSVTLPAPTTRRAPSWAPVGWIASGAAATLLVVFGLSQLHLPAGGSLTTAGSQAGSGSSTSVNEVAPLSQSYQYAPGAAAARSANDQASVNDPRDSSRSLTVATSASAYPASGILSIRVATGGLTSQEASSARILLVKNAGKGGYAVKLGPPTSASGYPFTYDASYSIPEMQLPSPAAGSYTLQVTVQLSGGSVLIASLPLTITS
jgi:Putative zinc-finger